MKNTLIFVLLSCLVTMSCAQTNDSTFTSITRALERSVARGHDDDKCGIFSPTVFSIAVTFGPHAKVDDVLFSNPSTCFYKSKERISLYIKEYLNGLRLDRSDFANTYILAALYILPEEARKNQTHSRLSEEWNVLFKDIDINALHDKRPKFFISTSIYLLPRIEN